MFRKLKRKVKKLIKNLKQKFKEFKELFDYDFYNETEYDYPLESSEIGDGNKISLQDILNDIERIYKNFKNLNQEPIEENVSLEDKIQYSVSRVKDMQSEDADFKALSFGDYLEELPEFSKFCKVFRTARIINEDNFISMIRFFKNENIKDINEEDVQNMFNDFVDFHNNRKASLKKYPERDLTNLKLVNKDFKKSLEAKNFKDIDFDTLKKEPFNELPKEILVKILSYVVHVNDDLVSNNPLIKDYVNKKLFQCPKEKVGYVQKFKFKKQKEKNYGRNL